MALGIVCLVLAVLAGFQVTMKAMWNRAHTANGILGNDPIPLLLTLAIAVLAGIAGVYLIVRARRHRG